jgi:HEAT repeat protein
MSTEIESLLEELVCGDDARADFAAIKLAEFGESVEPSIRQKLESKDADTRWWAIRTFAQMKKPPMELVLQGLTDSSTEVQQCAILAICHHPDVIAIPMLLKLISGQESTMCHLTASALIAIGKESIPGLLTLLPDLSDVSRIEAVRAIAYIEDPRAIPVLKAGMDEDSVIINYWAEEGLDRLGLGMVYLNPE